MRYKGLLQMEPNKIFYSPDAGVLNDLLFQELNSLYSRAAVIDKHSRRCNSLPTPSFLTMRVLIKMKNSVLYASRRSESSGRPGFKLVK